MAFQSSHAHRALTGVVLTFTLLHIIPTMAQTTPTLGEVVVQDVASTQDPRKFAARTSVITAEDIRQMGANSVNDAILRSVGAFSKLNTAGGQDRLIDLRGFGETSGSNLVVLVDGVRQNESDMDGNNLSWIPIEAVQSIEVTRGGSSVMYGEGATGGVINIITHQKGIGPGGQLGFRVGNFGQRETQATVGQQVGDWALMASGFKRMSDNHRDNFRTDEQSVLLQGSWRKDQNKLTLRHASQVLNSGLPGGMTEADFLSRSRVSYKPSDNGKTLAESWLASLAGTTHSWNWVADWTHRRKTVESNYVADSYATKTTTPSDRWGLRAWQKGQLGAFSTQVVLGLDAESWKQTRLDESRIEQNMQAAYGKFELGHAPSGLTGFVGARRTLADKKASAGLDGGVLDRNTSADGGLSWVMSERSQAYVYRGNSFRLANADEYVCYPVYGTCAANPVNTLAPQRSQDTELGYQFTTAQMRQAVRVYQHKLTHEIGLDQNNSSNINYDPTVHKGVEWDQSLRLNSNWSLKTQVASRDNRFVAGTFAGQTMPAPQESIQAQLTHAWNNNARLTWTTTWFSEQRIPGDFAGTCASKIPSFNTHDLFYFRQVAQWQWTAGVRNLTNENHYTVRTRCSPTSRSIYPEAGRSFFVGGKYLF